MNIESRTLCPPTDSLSRSTELIISSGHYQLEPAPTTHVSRLSERFESSYSDYQDPQYAAVNQSSFIMSDSPNQNENSMALSDAESSTSLQKVHCYSSGDMFQKSDARQTADEPVHSLDDEDKAHSTTNLSDLQRDKIPMKRNNSYRVLEINGGEQNTENKDTEAGELLYSYPRLKSTGAKSQGSGYTTVSAGNDESDPYSKIELANLYENILPDENMMENELYGSTVETDENYIAGMLDPYMNDGLGPR